VHKKLLQIGNLLSVVFAIVANYWTATASSLPKISAVSENYTTFLTPADYAFSVWLVIYVMIALLALYQARDVFKSDDNNRLPAKMAGWFMVANVCNGLWTYVFVEGYTGLSVAVILTLLASLLILIKRLQIAVFDAEMSTVLFVWWAILPYAGWVLVASVVNIASWLTKLGVTIAAHTSALVILALGLLLSLLLWTRNVRSLVLASIWGIVAIAANSYTATPTVGITAAGVSALLLLETAMHAYRNRAKNPLAKLR